MRLFVCFLVCFSFNYLSAQKEVFQAVVLDEVLTKNANAIVRLAETSIEITSPKSLKKTYKRVVTVLNKKGNDHLNLQLYFDDEIKIKKLGAIVYNSLGEEIRTYKNGDFKDVAAVSSFSLYEDSRVKYVSYTPIAYPYTIEFFYETITSNTAWIPFWRPLEGYYISTEKSSYTIAYDSSVGILSKEKKFANYTIKNQSKEGFLKYTAENLEVLEPESMSPSFRDLSPVLMVTPKNFHYEGYVGETGDWESLGKWMYDHLLEGRTQLSEETKQMAQALVKGIDNPIEKARKIYAYVQENTRYISVQVGIGGIQPITAAEVDKVKYGDCKGLTNYTKALLEAVGVPSYYAEVYAGTREQINVDKDFASLLGQANHVILNIPIKNQEPVWLECTSQSIPFGFLGDFTDNRDVFVITPEGGKIVKTPNYSAEENRQTTTAEVSVFENQSIAVAAKIISKGIQYNNKYYLEKEEKRNQDKHYKNYWDYVGNITLDEMKYENDKDSLKFTELVRFTAVNFVAQTAERFLFRPNVLNRITDVPNRYRHRKVPLKIERGFVDNDDYVINLPASYTVEFIPENITLNFPFGKYTTEIQKIAEDKFRYKRTLKILEGTFTVDAYDEYRNFMKEVSKNDNAKMVLIKK